MNKIYIPALAAMLIGGTAFAQNGLTQARTNKTHVASDNVPQHGSHSNAPQLGVERVTPFWTEDFSGGSIPAGWTNTDDTSAPGQLVTFVYSSNSADVSVAALGYTASADFMAASASNGYVWCNSDRGLPAAPAVNHHTQLTTGPISCIGETSVLFSMQSLIGVFDNDAADFVKLRVSTDQITWTDYSPFPCLVTGAAAPPCTRWSANPQNVEVDITASAANQIVYLQFEWTGGWEYFWAIDDIALSPVPDHERQMLYAYLSHTGQGLEYGRVPTSQLGADFIVGAAARNTGLLPQTNVVINANVLDPVGNPSFNATETFAVVAPGDTAAMEMNVVLPSGLAEGTYTVNVAVSSNEDALEEDPSDDSLVRTFTLDNVIYSLDNIGLNAPGTESLSSLGTASFTDATDGLIGMTQYNVSNNLIVHGIEIDITAASVAGASLIVGIRDTSDVLADPAVMTNLLAESDFYVLTAADIIAGVVRIPFTDPVTLTPNAYYAGVEMFSNVNANNMGIMDDVTVPQPGNASMIYIAGDQVYGNGNALAVRLVMDPNIGISETATLNGISIFPNPSNGIFRVNADVQGVYTVEITNVAGKVVKTTRINGSASIDLSNEAKGVYMVRVSNEKATTVQRVTLK